MDSHNEGVARISSNLKSFYSRREPHRIYHGATNSTKPAQLDRDRLIDTSGLTNILKIDREAKTVLVEPNVPMDSLVQATIPFGLVPPVVMEFPGITVGGGFSGTSAESSSFRHSFFDRTVNWIEICLATGEKVHASKTNLSDLFYGAASAFGTLGVITLLELQLVDAKPYVELTYYPISSIDEAVRRIEAETMDTDVSYLDGVLFAKNRGLICSGRFVDTPKSGIRVQKFTGPRDPWFYIHAERIMKKQTEKVVEAIPLVDYLFRYDRGGFWVAKYAFNYFITPYNRITRWALDYFMHTRVMYHALHKSGLFHSYVIQDVGVPYPTAQEFTNYLDQDFGHYPLWLCPLKQVGTADDSSHGLMPLKRDQDTPEFILNFGVWGPGPKGRKNFIDMNRRLEKKVTALGGKKALYAQAFYTEDEFWQIYNLDDYEALRAKYCASHLPSVYDKVKIDYEAERRAVNASWWNFLKALFWGIWPLAGLYGVLAVLLRRDYLLPKRREKRKS